MEYLNKITLGNCYELIKQLPDKSVDLIVTDPPYFIENTKAGGKSNLAKSIQKMNNQLVEYELCQDIDNNILEEYMRVLKVPNLYIWCNHKQIPKYIDYFVTKQGCAFDIIIWNKTNAMPLFNNKYLTDKEYCLYFRRGGRCQPKDYESAKTVYYQPINMSDKSRFEHITIKPLNIIKTLIENSTQPNDIVLDTFMGSGTTAVSCYKLQRHFIVAEIDKEYFEKGSKRLFDVQNQVSLFELL